MRIKQAKAERLLRQASLFNTYANVDLLEYIPERNIDKALIDRLCSCAYIDEAVNVIVTGAAGTGKSFIRVGGETRSHRSDGSDTPVLAPGAPEP